MLDAVVGAVIVVVATSALVLALEVAESSMDAAGRQPLSPYELQLLQQAGRDADVDAEYRKLIDDYPDELALGYQYARYLAEAGRVDLVLDVPGLRPDLAPQADRYLPRTSRNRPA